MALAEIHTMIFNTSSMKPIFCSPKIGDQGSTNVSMYTSGSLRLFRKTVFESGLANTMFLPTYVPRNPRLENIHEHVRSPKSILI